MATIETDYLVIGAGASGMAFTDALIADSGAEVVIVDRRHRPGGHWNDGYPFLRLHQPSAYYGVNSRELGNNRIDETGPNAGFYERASAAEVCDYYGRVMDEQMLPSGHVRFFGMSDHVSDGNGSHAIVSRLSGKVTDVVVRRKVVDATLMQVTLPNTHTPSFRVDADARVVPPHDLVSLVDGGSGFTIIGAGKTAMDTCCWLCEQGVDPSRIRWIRPSDVWAVDRRNMQPMELVGPSLEWLARQTELAAEAEDVDAFFERLEAEDGLNRLDPDHRPTVFRGPILSQYERTQLRSIDNVVRLGRVLHIGADEIVLERGAIPTDRSQIHVDCSAPGIGTPAPRPIFETGRINIQRVIFGIDPFNGAVIGHVEATRQDDEEKNRLCPPNPGTGAAVDFLVNLRRTRMTQAEWFGDGDLRRWQNRSRLTPLRDLRTHMTAAERPAMDRLIAATFPAIENLTRILAEAAKGEG